MSKSANKRENEQALAKLEKADKPTRSKKAKELVPCELCQGTGLELPDGNIKYLSQSKASCKECDGSGSIEK